jgi:Na+/proline symporter
MTLALGSIPQQDVFQRVTSAKSESVAVKGTLIGGVVYFFFAFVPIFIAYAALVIDPQVAKLFASEDDREIQRILPELVLGKGIPMWAKVMFFGALMSAILSSASGALLAPSALFTANALRPFVPHMSDRQFLLSLRLVLVSFTLAATVFALNSTSTMYEMVQNAYKVTLSGAFVPLVAGIFWKRANNVGALAATVLGISAWLLTETIAPEGTWPPQLVGLAVSTVAMIAGSFAAPAPHPHPHPQK